MSAPRPHERKRRSRSEGRPDIDAERYALLVRQGTRKIGVLTALARATLDLVQAYREVRGDHITECRCRAEYEFEVHQERVALLRWTTELHAQLDNLETQIARPLWFATDWSLGAIKDAVEQLENGETVDAIQISIREQVTGEK